MTKHTLTLEFTSLQDLHAAVSRMLGKNEHEQIIVESTPLLNLDKYSPVAITPEPQAPVATAPVDAPAAPVPAGSGAGDEQKRKRKPRSDAGQPRGSYKANADGAAGGEQTPATSPTADPAPAAPSAPAAVAPDKKLTHDDVREALAQINKVPGLGMAGCHAFLASFTPTGAAAPGVKRISDVPEADFARFIAEVGARIAKFQAEGK